MSDETTEKSSKVWLYVTGSIIALPLLYVLSIGPMAVLVVRKIMPEEGFELIYAPLGWFCTRTDTWDTVWAYAKMWCALTSTPWPR